MMLKGKVTRNIMCTNSDAIDDGGGGGGGGRGGGSGGGAADNMGTGFRSIERYGPGFFGIKLKIPAKKTTGIITTFYLISQPNDDEQRHEVDFEFLGSDTQHYLLSTNVISNGNLHREQQFALWFDSAADFHFYQILWNRHQLVLFVDGTPIRVLKYGPSIEGIFPTKPMEIQGTIWNATWGSQGKAVNWGVGPFHAYYQGFGVDGCSAKLNNPRECYSLRYEWNRKEFWELNQHQQNAYEHVRRKYLTYDCYTKTSSPTPECKINY
ncbi:putative xyloglucan endotransglucosylase/hydrolase protein 1 [Pyrus x bretschneideri]|uniref:putative xyloglucan endotransglucosylase/hydrolase protein 1 n=1 Tax=Pyrus x bretschneideri TaxID=225117 RepID=UPI002030A558|nr:putative xyloglucan endotransglucosylase/hydrolase protein 1 [Pyrus x bretschneideri]